jgi:hypothetical protein
MEITVRPGENPVGKPAIEASYKQPAGQIAILNHRLGTTDLSKCESIDFDIASRKSAQMVVSIEMVKVDGKGPRYRYLLEVGDGMRAQQISIPISEFVLEENSAPDPAGKFDLRRARSLSLLDVSGALGASTEANTLWLADVRCVVKP